MKTVLQITLISAVLALVQPASASPDLRRSPMVNLDDATEPPGAEMTDRGRNIRGVYIPVTKLYRKPVDKLVNWIADDIEAQAVILDIKDDSGRVTFTRDIPLAKRAAHGYLDQMAALVNALQARDVYVIGRLVCFKDHMLPSARPMAAIIDRRTKRVWRDKSGRAWLDPYSEIAHQHIANVAVAAQNLGFDEIQLDYVRFPVDAEAKHAVFYNRRGNTKRHQAIAGLLKRVDNAIRIPLSIDVFGLTAVRKGDPNGLGQSLEHLAPYIDAISPMLYLANWHPKVWQNADLKIVKQKIDEAVRAIEERLPSTIVIRPLLQGFPFRASKLFGVAFIQDQIAAAEGAGASGHLFWSPSGRYNTVGSAWKKRDAVREQLNEGPKLETYVSSAANSIPPESDSP